MTLFLESQGRINRVTKGEGSPGVKGKQLERRSLEKTAQELHGHLRQVSHGEVKLLGYTVFNIVLWFPGKWRSVLGSWLNARQKAPASL